MRVKIFLIRGNDYTIDCDSVRLTPDSLVLERREVESDKNIVVAEFYRAACAGYKRETD